MKHIKWAALFLALCMLLCACTEPGGNDTGNDPVSSGGTQTNDQGGTTQPDDDDDNTDSVSLPSDLTVELVMDSSTANILLSYLDDMNQKLRDAVESIGYQPDTVTITFSTAGAYTTDSLREGGVAVAVLPALDVITCDHARIIALSSEEIPETAIAVSMADEIFSEDFCSVLYRAFTETEAGREFLALCCADITFTAPTEEMLQTVRDYLAELEKNSGGHA